MATITLTIPDNKISRITTALASLYPIPLDDDGDPEYTDNQWGKECVRRWLVRQTARYETKVAKDAASVAEEDDLIS